MIMLLWRLRLSCTESMGGCRRGVGGALVPAAGRSHTQRDEKLFCSPLLSSATGPPDQRRPALMEPFKSGWASQPARGKHGQALLPPTPHHRLDGGADVISQLLAQSESRSSTNCPPSPPQRLRTTHCPSRGATHSTSHSVAVHESVFSPVCKCILLEVYNDSTTWFHVFS